MKVIVYAGKHYGREHLVISREWNMLICLHEPSGDTVRVHQSDAEVLPEVQEASK